MYSLGGYSLANGAVTIDPTSNPSNNGGGQPIIGILLVNAQPVPVNIQMDSTTSTMLAGNGATVLPVSGAQGLAPSKITVTPTAVTTGDVLVTVFQQGDSLPLSTPSNTTIQNAPMARLAYTASNVTIRAGVPPITATTNIGPIGLLPTERSIVVIFSQPTGSTALSFGLVVKGLVSGAAYYDGSYANEAIASFGRGYGWPALVSPAYGTVDEQVELTVGFSSTGGNVVLPEVYVLAVPDEVLQGTPANPTQVTGTVEVGVTGPGSAYNEVLYVKLSDGTTNNTIGAQYDPLTVQTRALGGTGQSRTAGIVVSSGSTSTLIGPPAFGIRVIDAISSFTGGTAADLTVDTITPVTHGVGLTLPPSAAQTLTPTGLFLSSGQTLYATTGSATSPTVTVWYHDEEL